MNVPRTSMWFVALVAVAVVAAVLAPRWLSDGDAPDTPSSATASTQTPETSMSAAAPSPSTARRQRPAPLNGIGYNRFPIEPMTRPVAGTNTDAPLDSDTLIETDPVTMGLVQRGIEGAVRDGVIECMRDFRDPKQAPDEYRRAMVTLTLEVSSQSSTATIGSANADEWPDSLHEGMKDCVLAAFEGAEFDADEFDFAYKIEYPVVLSY